ncbi:efflux RND transporter periplasmic adaptor subunit [Myxococcus sp. K15C18031901]|nr:efflux RND transporter periplasmic adaptor subunit [Myxococcus dinghuensis]
MLGACGAKPEAAAGGAWGAGPVEVGVVALAASPVSLTKELPGRTSAFRVAEVRARVNGIVLKRFFDEGSDVKEGQVLFQIDPQPYQAALDSAKAALARAEASLELSRLQAERATELLAARAISKQEFENASAAQKVSVADVASAKAAVQSAQINLGYTRVTAPVSGRIGRAEVTEGAYVQQGQATLMARVQQLDPLYVDVSESSVEVLRLRRELEAGRLRRSDATHATVKLLLEDGTECPEPGTLQFSDVTVEPSTGSLTLRVLVPNPGQRLLPGMFVRARLEEGVDPDALLVPQSAVTRDARGRATALVVGAQNKVEPRVLVANRSVGDQWLVTEGLAAGDQVIVEGLQKVRPGSEVRAVPAGSAVTRQTR